MANEDGSEDRLTKSEFAELIQHLSVQEILTIEYRVGTNWSKLFSRKNVLTHIFFCNLCVLETSSFKNLLAHIDGRKHKLQMEKVKQLYHPDYTYPKNWKKEEEIEISSSKKGEDDNIVCSIQKAVRKTQNKTAEGNNGKEIPQNIEINKNNKIKSKSSTDFEKNKSDKKSDDSLNNSADIDIQNDIGKGDALNEHKNEEKTATLQACNKDRIKPLDVGGAKHDIKLKDTKKVCVEKRLPADNIEGISKKRKIVVNPAAALSLKAKEENSEESNNMPQYQRDKIIIPTVHKTKSHNDKCPMPTRFTTKSDNPQFSEKLYATNANENDVYGILGVEYVIKILKNRTDISPRYECGLCELVLDGFAMQRHLEGYNHRLKFCEKHFPTAIRQYRQYMQSVPESEIFKVMAPVLAKLAKAIEQHHGRNLPYECLERDFSLNRHEILAKAFSCRHASEQYGPTFTHVVGSKEIDEFINNRHKYLPPAFSRSAIFDIKAGNTTGKFNNRHQNSRNINKEYNSQDRHRHASRENAPLHDTIYKSYMSSGLHEDMYPPSSIYKQGANRNHIQYVDDETYNLMVDDFLKGTLKSSSKNCEIRRNSYSPARNSGFLNRKSSPPIRQHDIWQTYRHMVDQELYNLDERFKQYRKDPETHPTYNEEWQKFWKRRKDELVSAGLDHRKYNYQPEWVSFIKMRIEELYSKEVENLKIKSREQLCLPLINDNSLDVKYHVKPLNTNSTTGNHMVSTIESSTLSTSLHSSNISSSQVVSVLRLMTALEDILGSLGPKVIDLLSKALQTEKINPLHVNAIILNDENCSLIETAKEKCKGLVITGLFEGSKKRVLNQVVRDAEILLQYAYQFKEQLASQRSSIESSTNRTQTNSCLSFDLASANVSSIPKNQNQSGGSNVDKKELASKLAASLVAQGKTDFEPQQLQQLIAVYKLIEKKKRENSGIVQSNFQSKGNCSLQEFASTGKKTLSDTLSDLLKSSSTSMNRTSDVSISNISHSTSNISSKVPDRTQYSSNTSDVFGNSGTSNSFASALQNSSDNYFSNAAAQSIYNVSGGRETNLGQQSDYGMNYPTNNLTPNQRDSNLSNMYNNQYQNNRMPQNWGWSSNMGMNQNYNNNKNSNWQNF